MDKFWKFASIDRIEDFMFNPSLERFYKFKIDGTVRENIQNSLDARNYAVDKPVVVTINLDEIHVNELPGINEILERIPFLKGQNEYTKETIENMKKVILENKINVISFEDENTKGLKYTDDREDTWKAYAYKKGVHNIDPDIEIENNRGGSHGVGKIASNAASELFLIYFSNCDGDGNKHIGGTIQLIEHEFKEKYHRSTGYFVDDFEKEIPFENNYRGIFQKDTRGLKLIIPFYKKDFGDEFEIIKSICDSFFLAIVEKKLVVKINAIIIDHESIESFIENDSYYPKNLGPRSTEMTPLYYNTFTNEEKKELEILDKNRRKYHFDLYFKYDESITKGRVAIIRSIGMKIEDFKISSAATKPFNAVLIPKNSDCDKFLKSLENESHTEISWKHFKVKSHQENAKYFINNLDKAVKKKIDDCIKQNNETEGQIRVDDIIYEVENSFREILNEKNSIMSVGNSTIIKRKPEKRKKSENKLGKSGTPAVTKQRKPKTINENGDREKDELYSVTPHLIRRALTYNREILEIDMSSSDEIKSGRRVDLSLKVVDGMGLEYGDEFFMEDNYSTVYEQPSGETKIIKDNKIKDILVQNNRIKIILGLKENFNRSLKFRYYLEV